MLSLNQLELSPQLLMRMYVFFYGSGLFSDEEARNAVRGSGVELKNLIIEKLESLLEGTREHTPSDEPGLLHITVDFRPADDQRLNEAVSLCTAER